MKYIVFLFFLVSVGIGVYKESANYKDLNLIIDIWEIPKEEIPNGYSLVNLKGNNLEHYELKAVSGFVNIAKELWLIIALAIVTIVILLPFSIYVLKAFWNTELSEANQAKQEAKNAIYKSEMALIDAQNKYQKECDLKVKNAYDTQRKIVQNELSKRKTQVEQRENLITEREAIAERKVTEANTKLAQYQAEVHTLKLEFEKKEKLFTKSRNNAVAAMNRRKRKHI